MTTPLGYGELLQCPFEKAHRIQAHAMSKHLFKCRQNYPNQKFVSCPFNESHRVAAVDLKSHISECEDRATFDTYKYSICTSAANVPQNAVSPPELVYNNSPPKEPEGIRKRDKREKTTTKEQPVRLDDDCWDDMNAPAYNPQKYCEKASVIRKATLKKPSEKKAFYECERLRLQDLKLTND
ncbi:gametocyte-specific factor 1 homolog [Topomyia yanbarensis]|uniref:gametocyte-specific factor 1 homolog n=1 Tax=Topomyia yanbarensis TaxID=2498891 RepID=UPI00273BE3A4|nr:gametocyte-specific factor 1 homolog [Topomyia yanbarensis]